MASLGSLAASATTMTGYDPVAGDTNIDTYSITLHPGLCLSNLSQKIPLNANNEFLLGFLTVLWAMFPTSECNSSIEVYNPAGVRFDVQQFLTTNDVIILEGRTVTRVVNEWPKNKWRKPKAALLSLARKEVVAQFDTLDFYNGMKSALGKLGLNVNQSLAGVVENTSRIAYVV